MCNSKTKTLSIVIEPSNPLFPFLGYLFRLVTLHVVPVVGAEVLQGEAEDGEEEVEKVADAQEQQQHVERPQALLKEDIVRVAGRFRG